ncbi:MAG: hypothetical protein ABR947_05150, partial [Solirubrobacteraceae bacterium]
MEQHDSEHERRQAREIARVLRARRRRTQVLRRRVGATALILLASMWGTIFALGSMGAATAAVTSTVADVRSASSGSTRTDS